MTDGRPLLLAALCWCAACVPLVVQRLSPGAASPITGELRSPALGERDAPPSARPFVTGTERWAGFGLALLELVNRDRRDAGIAELAADAEAMAFAQAEARRQVEEGAFGHHAADGSKPYQRWARRGGTAHLRENLFRLTAGEARAYMLFDPARAQARLMASRGHRLTILDPAHTGVGIGVAYDPAANSVYVVQEFVNRYVAVEGGSRRWRAGDARELRGRLLPGARVEPWMAVLYREPLPGSPAARRERGRRSYREGSSEPALALSRRAFAFDPANREFSLRMSLPDSAPPGPYTLIVYVADPQAVALRPRRSTAQGVPAATLTYEVER